MGFWDDWAGESVRNEGAARNFNVAYFDTARFNAMDFENSAICWRL